jgi:hypothetical protein
MLASVLPLSCPLRVLLRQRLLSPFWPDSFPDELSGTIAGQTFECRLDQEGPLISAPNIIVQRFAPLLRGSFNGSNLPLDGEILI